MAYYRFESSSGARIFSSPLWFYANRGLGRKCSEMGRSDSFFEFGGEFTVSFCRQTRNGGQQRRSATADEPRSMSLNRHDSWFSRLFLRSVVGRNEVLCVRIQLAKVYFDTHGKNSQRLEYSDKHHRGTLNVIPQLEFKILLWKTRSQEATNGQPVPALS